MINPFRRKPKAPKPFQPPPKHPGVNYTEATEVPESVQAMSGAMAEQLGSTPTERKDNLTAQRIYAEFKWKLKIAQRSWTELDGLLANCLHRCEQEIQTPTVRERAMDMFQKMRNKASEFNLEQEGKKPGE